MVILGTIVAAVVSFAAVKLLLRFVQTHTFTSFGWYRIALAMVFLISAWIGGEASARFTPLKSVGASGGLMGLLGFLLVFETLHRRLVPESSRRRLLAGVALTAAIGFVFRHFIDNAAHLGGLVAGMVYAALVFPRSSSPHRPPTTMVDVMLGGGAVGLLVSAAVFACVKMG